MKTIHCCTFFEYRSKSFEHFKKIYSETAVMKGGRQKPKDDKITRAPKLSLLPLIRVVFRSLEGAGASANYETSTVATTYWLFLIANWPGQFHNWIGNDGG